MNTWFERALLMWAITTGYGRKRYLPNFQSEY